MAFLFFLFVGIFSAFGLDYQAEGEKLLAENQLAQARTYLEAALAQGPPNEQLDLDLGLVYQKLGLPELALQTFRAGTTLRGPLGYLLWYNLGLVAFSTHDLATAESAYNSALVANVGFQDAYLNRANVRLEKKDWKGAIEDFQTYQKLAPDNPQKQTIDKVLALLNQAQTDQAVQALAEQTRQKEKAKADAQAAAEAVLEKQKQEALLAKIRNSLKNVSGDTKAMGTGPAGVKSDDGDFSLSQ